MVSYHLERMTMKKIIQSIGAAAVAMVVGLTTLTPVSAAPFAPINAQSTSDARLVQDRYGDDDDGEQVWKRRSDNRIESRHDRRGDGYDRRYDRRHDRVERRQERRGYWNGHRGYREHRRGYRRHSDGYYYSNDVFQLFIR
jgi:hypothetical protein